MPSVGVQLSRVCPVCVPAPPGAFLSVQRHRGEPGHTGHTRGTRTHEGTRTAQTNLTTIETHQQHTTRTSARRPKPRPTHKSRRPGVDRLLTGTVPVLSSVWSVCLFVRPRVPSVCPVRVSRLPPVSLYRYMYCTGCVSRAPHCVLPGTGTVPGTVQYTFY